MRRRTLVSAIGAGSLSLAGCAAVTELTGENLPKDCPVSQGLGVEWPRELNESTVAAFVEEYELEYYQQEVFDDVFEPQSRLDTYEGWIGDVNDISETSGGGWRVQFEGIVNIRRGDLALSATASDPPGGAELIPIHDIEGERLIDVLEEAAETGRAEQRIGPTRTDGYLDLFGTLSDEFELTYVDDSETLYFDLDGTTVELVVSWSPANRDHFWYVSYYVDEHVVWRSADADSNPRDGDLLECRTSS